MLRLHSSVVSRRSGPLCLVIPCSELLQRVAYPWSPPLHRSDRILLAQLKHPMSHRIDSEFLQLRKKHLLIPLLRKRMSSPANDGTSQLVPKALANPVLQQALGLETPSPPSPR